MEKHDGKQSRRLIFIKLLPFVKQQYNRTWLLLFETNPYHRSDNNFNYDANKVRTQLHKILIQNMPDKTIYSSDKFNRSVNLCIYTEGKWLIMKVGPSSFVKARLFQIKTSSLAVIQYKYNIHLKLVFYWMMTCVLCLYCC